LPILLVFIFSIISVQALSQLVFSQEDSDPSMIMSQSKNFEESITSYNDALIKAPLIVAQCTIVGIVFNQLVFSRIFYNRILMNFSGNSDAAQTNLGTEKRVSLVIILCVVALGVSCKLNRFEFDIRPNICHISNAGLSSPNIGFNTKNMEFGISSRF